MGDEIATIRRHQFDRRMLEGELQRAGLDRPAWTWLCSIALARKAWPGFHSYALTNLRAALQIAGGTAHRAAGDVHTTAEVITRARSVLGRPLTTLGIPATSWVGLPLSLVPAAPPDAYVITVACSLVANPGTGSIAWVLRRGGRVRVSPPFDLAVSTVHRAVLTAVAMALDVPRADPLVKVVVRTNLTAVVQRLGKRGPQQLTLGGDESVVGSILARLRSSDTVEYIADGDDLALAQKIARKTVA